jgi:hypothetical protein
MAVVGAETMGHALAQEVLFLLDNGYAAPEEIAKKRNRKLIRLREFLRELGEL